MLSPNLFANPSLQTKYSQLQEKITNTLLEVRNSEISIQKFPLEAKLNQLSSILVHLRKQTELAFKNEHQPSARHLLITQHLYSQNTYLMLYSEVLATKLSSTNQLSYLLEQLEVENKKVSLLLDKNHFQDTLKIQSFSNIPFLNIQSVQFNPQVSKTFHLEISQSYLSGLAIGALFNQQKDVAEISFFLRKLFILKQLAENKSRIESFLTTHPSSLETNQNILKICRSKDFEKVCRNLLAEISNLSQEPALREKIYLSYFEAKKKTKELSSETILKNLKISNPLITNKTLLAEYERALYFELINQIRGSNTVFSSSPIQPADLQDVLHKAHYKTIENWLVPQYPNIKKPTLPNIHSHFLKEWRKSILEAHPFDNPSKRIESMTHALIEGAIEFEEKKRNILKLEKIDYRVLTLATFQSLKRSETPFLSKAIEEISQNENYLSMRENFFNILSYWLPSLNYQLIQDSRISPDPSIIYNKIIVLIDKTNPTQENELEFQTLGSLGNKLQTKLQHEFKNDLTTFVDLGRKLGFFQFWPKGEPALKDILHTKKEIQSYQKLLQQSVWTNLPFLNEQLKLENMTLSEYLYSLGKKSQQSKVLMDKARQAVRSVFKELNSKTLQSLEKIASIESEEQLRVISQQGAFLRAFMNKIPLSPLEAFPIQNNDIVSKIANRQIDEFVLTGFHALIIFDVGSFLIKPLRPFTQIIRREFHGLFRGFFASSAALIATQTIHEYNKLSTSKDSILTAKKLASPVMWEDIAFADTRELSQLLEENKTAFQFLYGRIAFDSLVMYLPTLYEYRTSIGGAKVSVTEAILDIHAKKTLNLPFLSKNLQEADVIKHTETARLSAKNNHETVKIEQASYRLIQKLRNKSLLNETEVIK